MNRRELVKLFAGVFAAPLVFLGKAKTWKSPVFQPLKKDDMPVGDSNNMTFTGFMEYWDGKKWTRLTRDGYLYESQADIPVRFEVIDKKYF